MKKLSLLFAIIALISTPSCLMKPEKRIPAKITFTSGTVLHNGKAAQSGQAVRHGDIVQTGPRASCSIVIDDKNIVGMREDAILVYKIKSDDALIDLKRGFLGIIVKNEKNLVNFRVSTPTVTASARDASFFIGTETPDKTYTCICNGAILLRVKGSNRDERYAAAHHRAVYHILRGGTVKEHPGEQGRHTDRDMEKLAEEINVRIDWAKAGQ